MYYSTPGALKVQGLAARKVTAGSPLNSCKLSAGFGRGGGVGECGSWLWEDRLHGALFVNTPLHPQFGRNSFLGCWKR